MCNHVLLPLASALKEPKQFLNSFLLVVIRTTTTRYGARGLGFATYSAHGGAVGSVRSERAPRGAHSEAHGALGFTQIFFIFYFAFYFFQAIGNGKF